MPKWGLIRVQRYAEPWGLPGDLLAPAKTITDPVHGDIYVTKLEQLAIDSPPVQRLRRVKQLGTSHVVYPGATHTRFSHVLGALRVAQDLVDAVVDARNGPRPADDLLGEWDSKPTRTVQTPFGEELISDFEFHLAEVTVLARLGGLLHDLCHVPFGHTVEDDLGVLDGHDSNVPRFERLWSGLDQRFRDATDLSGERLISQLRPLILSKTTDQHGEVVSRPIDDLEYPFVADIVGNTICADLIDYLQRDHLYAGLPAAFGHRFTNDFYVAPSSEVHFKKRMVIRITRDGHERPDVTTELLKFLRYRYELSERVLVHHAKLAVDAMIGKLLEMWRDALWTEEAQARLGELPPETLKDVGELIHHVEAHAPTQKSEIDAAVRDELEDYFTSRGDDGLLEELSRWGAGDAEDKRKKAIRQLAVSVLDRRFFKSIGRAESAHDRGLSKQLHKRFGTPAERRRLEQAAARCAGLEHRWAVVLWLPAPKMRLKVAEVLVDTGGQINALDKVGNARANDIYSSHEALWGVSVLADPDVVHDVWQERTLLSFLGQQLGIRFKDRFGSDVPSLAQLAVDFLAEQHELTIPVVRRLRGFVDLHQVAAHGGSETFAEITTQVEAIAVAEGVLLPTV